MLQYPDAPRGWTQEQRLLLRRRGGADLFERWSRACCPRHEKVVVIEISVHASRNFRCLGAERRTAALQENHGYNASDVSLGIRGEPSVARARARACPRFA